ncbi:MAG: DUF5686 and carboxypeptidase regulatory-like domain-containing protein, partial [Cyclobacteriaceae bacterium]|nr:DUF5686 and carboxypeptidase regulatory-like domain-containing protein [Cyclobacteriaceae bacterium]
MKHVTLLVLLITFCISGFCQTVSGIVADEGNKNPVAFAHITLNDRKTGTITDIDGRFSLTLPVGYTGVVYLSHINYKPLQLNARDFTQAKLLFLTPKITELNEVVIKAGENPAWPIIRKAVANKKLNDPDRKQNYSFTSYNKLILSGGGNALNKDSLLQARQTAEKKLSKADSSRLEMDNFLERSHFYVAESVTEKYFQQPGKNFEKLITHKASGFRSPLFIALPNDYQPTGFYQELVPLFGSNYLNPLSVNSEKKYDFELTDTVYVATDTLFVITFQPYSNTSFAGLKGKISISTNNYAIKNVIATNADPFAKVWFRIQQNYEFTNGHWFPVQLNTDVSLPEYKLEGRPMLIQVRSYLSNIKVNQAGNAKLFKGAQVDLSDSQYEQELNQYRPAPPEVKELKTYEFLDSVRSKVKVLETFDNLSTGLLSGTIPIGKTDLDTRHLVKINRFEGARFGVGLQTNPKISKRFQIGAFAGYGIHDATWKYGGFAKINIEENKQWYIQGGYENTIQEAGMQNFFERMPALSNRVVRNWQAWNFDNLTFSYIETGFRIAQNWQVVLNNKFLEQQSLFGYSMQRNLEQYNAFRFATTTAELTYVAKSQRVKLNGRTGLVRFQQPLFSFLVTQAWPGNGTTNNFTFTRYDIMASQQWKHRRLGTTQLSFYGGYLQGEAPIFYNYYGRGNRESSYLVDGYFQTMDVYEFIADRYASVFLTQNFGRVAWNLKYSRPELFVMQAAGWGELRNKEIHFIVPVNDYANGF